MSFSIGLDIGGTKIAGGLFASDKAQIAQIVEPTPGNYSNLISVCTSIVEKLDDKAGQKVSVGVGVPGSVDYVSGLIPVAANTPCLSGKPLRHDLQLALNRPIRLANDADCAALSEAVDGAGVGHRTVFGLIIGTGVGGGFVVDGKIVEGPNGMTGEFGHVPLPFREAVDGPFSPCVCGQRGCIDKSISGLALARLYEAVTEEKMDAAHIAEHAWQNDESALHVLDVFYTTVAKALPVIIHTFDPEVIVVSGGLSNLPGFYEEIPKRWGQYCLAKKPKTKFVPAKHGPLSGLRGAAWVGQS